jgi:hypothetical protein
MTPKPESTYTQRSVIQTHYEVHSLSLCGDATSASLAVLHAPAWLVVKKRSLTLSLSGMPPPVAANCVRRRCMTCPLCNRFHSPKTGLAARYVITTSLLLRAFHWEIAACAGPQEYDRQCDRHIDEFWTRAVRSTQGCLAWVTWSKVKRPKKAKRRVEHPMHANPRAREAQSP